MSASTCATGWISRAKAAATCSSPTARSPRSSRRRAASRALINLICDRALQRGHRTRAMLIEAHADPRSHHIARDRNPAPDVTVARSRHASRSASKLPSSQAGTSDSSRSRSSRSSRRSSVPVTHLSGSPQILSEFAAEADLAGPLSGVRSGKARCCAALLALLAAGVAATWFLSVDHAARSTSKPRCCRHVPMGVGSPAACRRQDDRRRAAAATSPPAAVQANDGTFAIQVASFSSRTRADRLVTELAQARVPCPHGGVQPRSSARSRAANPDRRVRERRMPSAISCGFASCPATETHTCSRTVTDSLASVALWFDARPSMHQALGRTSGLSRT